jgi:hypothetical protein
MPKAPTPLLSNVRANVADLTVDLEIELLNFSMSRYQFLSISLFLAQSNRFQTAVDRYESRRAKRGSLPPVRRASSPPMPVLVERNELHFCCFLFVKLGFWFLELFEPFLCLFFSVAFSFIFSRFFLEVFEPFLCFSIAFVLLFISDSNENRSRSSSIASEDEAKRSGGAAGKRTMDLKVVLNRGALTLIADDSDRFFVFALPAVGSGVFEEDSEDGRGGRTEVAGGDTELRFFVLVLL